MTPKDKNEHQACLEIERIMDKKLGENIRRILYHRLLAHPDFIRYCFTHTMPGLKKLLFRLLYPILRPMIYQSYVTSTSKVEQARREFDLAMAELEQKLKSRQYLVGDQFTRADLSVASMLSWLVMPPEHPFPWREIPDPQVLKFYDKYRDHPVSDWVLKMYRQHRLPVG